MLHEEALRRSTCPPGGNGRARHRGRLDGTDEREHRCCHRRPGTLIGEGGDGITPIMTKLLHDDAAGLNPDFGSYTGTVDIDHGIADFVGTAPGTFGNDFTVTERQLTSAEAATAKANGRSFAYVPIAAVPVALVTQVPIATWSGTTIEPADFCQHIPLTLDQLDGIYGTVTPPYSGWGDSQDELHGAAQHAGGSGCVRPLGQPRPDHGELRPHVAARQHHGLGGIIRCCAWRLRRSSLRHRPAIRRRVSTGPMAVRPWREVTRCCWERWSAWTSRPEHPPRT